MTGGSAVLSDGGFWIVQILNSLQLAMLLFLLSVGLTVIFGLMNFVNLAHGSLYAAGALIGYSVTMWTGSVWWAYLLAPVAVMALGWALYGLVIDRMRKAGPMNQVLVTFGLIFVLMDVQRYIWGTDQVGVQNAPFSGSIEILGQIYPEYRLFIIAVGLGVFALLYLALEYTRLGAEVRAGVDDAETASCLGVNVERTFLIVFLIGCALAGLAGAVALPAFSAEAGMGIAILIPTLVVVVVGGLGSLTGALAGSLLIATTLTFGQVFLPKFAGILMYALLVVILLVRPQGLFPARS
ncbi:MAG: branched-chain amino acid ABC transporter permease [Alphaproteobacteria bacterium]|nr:branched-chain amino acid ABC transporter permease [Alphaproteobacteria bacterium]MDX5369418.1 branched-chain amino acid ABC transporter permease [Alphaproteobacteria bacterium]MDX5464102.1 branched-chain amino acid ABC transporter permease [Alphaproteobacteria bacterium]